MLEEKKQQKINHETRVDLAFGISLGEWIIAGLVGVASGLTAAAATVRSNFKEEMKSWPGIKDLLEGHSKDLERINEQYRNNPTQGWKEHAKAISTKKTDYAVNVDEILEKQYKIVSRGNASAFSKRAIESSTLGTWQRYNFSGVNHDKKRIVFNSIVSAAIGGAATLSFFNGVASRHKIEQISDDIEVKNQR